MQLRPNFGVIALAQGGVGVGAGLSKEVITTETGKGNTAKVSLEKERPFKLQGLDFGFTLPSTEYQTPPP